MAPDQHTDTKGPQGSVPQSLSAQHCHIWLVLGCGHLQLMVGPDSFPALAQQGLGIGKDGRKKEVTEESGLEGKGGSACPRAGGLAQEHHRSSRKVGQSQDSAITSKEKTNPTTRGLPGWHQPRLQRG